MKSKLKEIIEGRGLKQTYIADKIGVDKTHLNRIVNGNILPKLDLAYRIAEVLELTVYDIWKVED